MARGGISKTFDRNAEVYTMEYYSAIKEGNDAICSNMNANRYDHIKGSK